MKLVVDILNMKLINNECGFDEVYSMDEIIQFNEKFLNKITIFVR